MPTRVMSLPDPDGARLAQGDGVRLFGNRASVAVKPLVLEIDHRVIVANCRNEQTLGGIGVGRHHALQAGDVAEDGVEGLGMLGGAAEAGANAGQHGEWHLDLAPEHVPHLGRVVQQLVHANAHKVNEHQLGDCPHSGGGGANGRSHEGSLGKGSIQDPLVAELLNQANGSAKGAAPGVHDAQVFPAGTPRQSPRP